MFNMVRVSRVFAAPVALSFALAGTAAASPWASQVIAYTPGTGVDPAYADPSAALGEPTRFTGAGVYPGAVTPFNPPWMAGELVSIGPGGSLTVQFATPVVNAPSNPFGIDFLVFSNAGLIDTSYPAGIAGGTFGAQLGNIEVSADGSAWHTIPAASIGGIFPSLGYADLTGPYATQPGTVLTDFTRPVNPLFDPIGKTFAEIAAAYAGSGGGTGIDIGAVGLNEISFVRISNPAGAASPVSIDAFAIVPAPGAAAWLLLTGALALRRRR